VARDAERRGVRAGAPLHGRAAARARRLPAADEGGAGGLGAGAALSRATGLRLRRRGG
jgi:hypothetical protein